MVEVGCGSGLRARSLTDWLGPGGLYDGLDADARARRVVRGRPTGSGWTSTFRHHAPLDDAAAVRGRDEGLRAAVGPSCRRRRPRLAVHLLREARRVLLPERRAVRQRLPARRPRDRGDRRRAREDPRSRAGRARRRRAAAARRPRTRSGCWTASPRPASRPSGSGTARGPAAPTGARRSTSSSRGCERARGPAAGRARADRRAPPRPRARHLLRCAWATSIVDPGPRVLVRRRCSTALGGRVPRAILLTHIHLDHAGATGALVRRWPRRRGLGPRARRARTSSTRRSSIASATRIYGDDMQRLWGEIVPGAARTTCASCSGGERLGAVAASSYTPGHAKHHVIYLHEPTRTAFCGDVAGVRIGGGPVLPPTPPPDIDLEPGAPRSTCSRALGPGAARR